MKTHQRRKAGVLYLLLLVAAACAGCVDRIAPVVGLVNHWNFEPGALTADALGNAELINNGGIAAETVGTEPKSPGYGQYGVALNGTDQYFSVQKWGANEPWQTGKSTGTFVIAIKMPEVYDTTMNQFLAGRYDSPANQRIIGFVLNPSTGPNQAALYWGTGTGQWYEQAALSGLEANTRYILFFAFDAAGKQYMIRAYNVDKSQWLTDATGTFTSDVNLAGTASWNIGRADHGGYFHGTIYWAQLYNNYLTADQMTQIALTTAAEQQKTITTTAK